MRHLDRQIARSRRGSKKRLEKNKNINDSGRGRAINRRFIGLIMAPTARAPIHPGSTGLLASSLSRCILGDYTLLLLQDRAANQGKPQLPRTDYLLQKVKSDFARSSLDSDTHG